MSNFELYLQSKKIDARAFRAALPAEFETYHKQFSQSSAAAFDLQKKFYLNNLRLEFPVKTETLAPAVLEPARKKRPRPKIRKKEGE